jgi:Heparinase II/III-like protein
MKSQRFFGASLRILLLILASMAFQWGVGQGAWLPANADLGFPRTLLKASEVPAAQTWLAQPDILPLYRQLYAHTLAFNPGNMSVTGNRRAAAFAAKDAAFIYLLDRKATLSGLDTLTSTEASYMMNKSVNLLNLMNTAVEAYPDFENYLWRSNELTNNLIAYDLLKGAGVPDSLLSAVKTKLQEYAGNLHEEVAFDFLNLGFFSLHVDNHALRSSGALGLAAVVLNDATSSVIDERPTSWLAAGLYNIDNVLWRDAGNAQSIPGVMAGYAEGPHYLRFGMKHVLPFFHALHNFIPDTTLTVSFDGNTRTVRHPWHDPNYHLLYEWVLRTRLPDGRFPALEDSFSDVCYPDLAVLENPAYLVRPNFSRFNPTQTSSLWEQLNHSSDDVVADYIASMTSAQPATFPDFQALAESGNLVFRSGWDSTSTFVHFTAKNGKMRTSAKGHNQADASSFTLMSRNQILALDPGYLKWDRRLEVAEAQHHNLILVDGVGPATASTANPGDADAFIEDAYDMEGFDYAEVRCAYNGVDVVRRPLFMRKDYLVLSDQCLDGASHNYDWRLHGHGLEGGDSTTGYFDFDASAQRGVWRKNGVHLSATVTARGGLSSITREAGEHELRYDSIEAHTTLVAGKSDPEARFLSILLPFELDSSDVEVLCAPQCGSLKITRNGYTDICSAEDLVLGASSGLAGDLGLQAVFGLYSQSASGEFAQLVLGQGTRMTLGTDTLASASIPMDLAYSILDSVHGEGFVSLAGTIRIYHPFFVPGTVLGAQSWSFDAASEMLEIQFAGAGKFDVLEEVIIGFSPAQPLARLDAWPVPAKERLHVRAPGYGRLDWVDMQGRVIKSWPWTQMEGAIDLPMGDQVGILRFTDDGGRLLAARLLVRQ